MVCGARTLRVENHRHSRARGDQSGRSISLFGRSGGERPPHFFFMSLGGGGGRGQAAKSPPPRSSISVCVAFSCFRMCLPALAVQMSLNPLFGPILNRTPASLLFGLCVKLSTGPEWGIWSREGAGFTFCDRQFGGWSFIPGLSYPPIPPDVVTGACLCFNIGLGDGMADILDSPQWRIHDPTRFAGCELRSKKKRKKEPSRPSRHAAGGLVEAVGAGDAFASLG